MRLFYEAYPQQLAHCGLWQEINEEKELNLPFGVSVFLITLAKYWLHKILPN